MTFDQIEKDLNHDKTEGEYNYNEIIGIRAVKRQKRAGSC